VIPKSGNRFSEKITRKSKSWSGTAIQARLNPAPAPARLLERDPEKWEPIFGKNHAQIKILERHGDSSKTHPAPAPARLLERDPEKACPRT
jgi:hypothetical protein